jgi:hypothetical protein
VQPLPRSINSWHLATLLHHLPPCTLTSAPPRPAPLQEFKRRYGHDVSTNHKAVMRLRAEVEKAKQTLSTVQHAALEVDGLHEGLDFHTALTREKFESICGDLLSQCLLPVQVCMWGGCCVRRHAAMGCCSVKAWL